MSLFAAGELLLVPHAYSAQVLRARLATVPGPQLMSNAAEPRLHARDEWMAALWSDLLVEGVEDRVLLNRLQEEQIWADIVEDRTPDAGTAARLRELAATSRTAFQLAAAHGFEGRLRAEADTGDARTFALWASGFRDHCEQHRLLPPSLLESSLAAHLRAGSCPAPATVHLLGFAEQTPAQAVLLNALRDAGTEVVQLTLRQPATGLGRKQAGAAASEAEELEVAARLLAEAARRADPAHPGHFAVIAENADALRPELERQLRHLLAPELKHVGADLSSTPWQFSAPPALATLPILADALSLLRWTVEPLPIERLGQLLLSPFFGWTDALEMRARFELNSLRNWPLVRPALDLASFVDLLHTGKQPPEASFPELRRLAALVFQSDLLAGRRTYADWTEQIRRLLSAAGWPGQRTLSPAEFQATEGWDALLDLLATLQIDGSRPSFAQMLDMLEAEARRRRAPVTYAAAPVQILTFAETAGLWFDHAILLDATDRNLPALSRPHPLLPQARQRAAGLTDAASSVSRTATALDALALASASLTLLAPRENRFGEVQMTPLARALSFAPFSPETLLAAGSQPAALALERTPEPAALPPLPSPEVRGGARVLELQAACGFRAFATLRLLADEPPSRQLGLGARETGNLLHMALQHLWAALGSHAQLRALPAETRRSLIAAATEAALARHGPSDGRDRWAASFLDTVRRRFHRLLDLWLDKELERAPFAVLAQEQQQFLELGPLRLNLRFDRVDEVEGGRIFIDYKSSAQLSSRDWLDARPDLPQLPAYALCAEPEQLKGVAFGRVRRGDKMSWISLSSEAGLFPRKGDNRLMEPQTQIEAWRAELTALAEAFAAGDTSVDPKSYPNTCRYCAHRALCRLDPSTLTVGGDDEAAEGSELG